MTTVRLLTVLLLLSLVLGGCRCSPTIGQVDIGFRVAPETKALEFGRVREGDTKTLAVTLIAETRVAVTVTVSTAAPFSAPSPAEVPGGDNIDVPVTFTAGNGEATGVLTLSVGDKHLEVPLHGVGVRPPECIPSGPCRISIYSLEDDRCVETVAPDETACDPGNVCLEQGRCRSGMCLGVARRCSDDDECTVDGCSMTAGCVHTPRTCPAPANPCRVATCDPMTGCGEGPAVDGTPCGSIDCVRANICVGGKCENIATPDGFECSGEIACLPKGFCRNQQCRRADAGEWRPAWSTRAPGEPSRDLLVAGGNLFFSTCGVPVSGDAGFDGGSDGGDDGGLDDGGSRDGGDDAGEPADAGSDAGLDGGADAGLACALASYTPTGFDRFVVPYEDLAPRTLVASAPRGLLLLRDGGVELRSRVTGALVDSLSARVHPGSVAVSADGGIQLLDDDGLLSTWTTDAGLVPVVSLGGPGVVALDVTGALYAWDSDAGVLVRVQEADGGLVVTAVPVPDAGLASLAAAQDRVLVGGDSLVRTLPDGGLERVPLTWRDVDGGALDLEEPRVLMSNDTAIVFYERCRNELTSCMPLERETWVRALDSTTGVTRWVAQVLPAGVSSQLEEIALASIFRTTLVATLVKADFEAFDAGVRAYLQVFSEGTRSVLCPLPPESSELRGAYFGAGFMFVLSDRDAGVTLEAFDLKGLSPSPSAWPLAGGLEGTRRAAP